MTELKFDPRDRRNAYRGYRWFGHSSHLLGKALDWTTPNWITAVHIASTPIILLCFAVWRMDENRDLWRLAGAVTYTLAVLSDWADGALATYQTKYRDRVPRTDEAERALPVLARLRLRGPTHTGARLDPIADKATFYSALLPLSVGYLPLALILANVALAFALTAIRWPKVMDRLRFTDVRANAYGKAKMQIEITAIAAIALFVPWPDVRYGLSVVTLTVATACAALSLREHFKRNRSHP